VHIKSCDREVQPMIPHSSTLARRAATYLFLLMPAIVAPQASADTSYLRPSWFTTATDDLVTAQSSFTESFSNPAIGVRSEAWTVIAPDGARSTFKTKVELTQLTALEADTKTNGTYRLSTGERLGRIGQQVLIDGAWQPIAPGREIVPGTKTRQSQTATLADVYVTRGAPTTAPVEARIGSLELRPVTHPNDVYLDTGFAFRVMLNGKPVANQQVEIWREGGTYEEPAYRKLLASGSDGEVKATFDKPGVYLFWTRMSGEAPAGAATPIRSYTTSITIEVQP
jgi:hypothetical protein